MQYIYFYNPTHHVAMMRVTLAVPIWSLGPTGPPLRAETYIRLQCWEDFYSFIQYINIHL